MVLFNPIISVLQKLYLKLITYTKGLIRVISADRSGS